METAAAGTFDHYFVRARFTIQQNYYESVSNCLYHQVSAPRFSDDYRSIQRVLSVVKICETKSRKDRRASKRFITLCRVWTLHASIAVKDRQRQADYVHSHAYV